MANNIGKELPKTIKEFNLNMTDADDVASVTVFLAKHKRQLKALAEAHPEEVKIVADGKKNDYMMVVHLPKKYCKVSFGEVRAKKEMTEEQKAVARERIKKMQEAKKVKAMAQAEANKEEDAGWL